MAAAFVMFLIATANPGEDADASHRGGAPGFIAVTGDVITWPDYAGNMMFNTIGNIMMHPWAGLAVPDFVTGGVLLLSGRASLEWKPDVAVVRTGAERAMRLEVEQVIELRGALPFTAALLEPSPFNP